MRPYTRSVIELFDGKKRYLIPLYQRHYAWAVNPQLALLWEDIERAVAKLETDRAASTPHFMGAIVIGQIKTFGKQVQAFEVIDGQQRLTTFQLLLGAFRDVAKKYNSEYETEVAGYLFNDGVMENPSVEKYKLWPSLTDRRSLVSIIDPEASLDKVGPAPDDEEGVVRPSTGAYSYFQAQIESHVVRDGKFDAYRMEGLFEALKDGLAVVSIEGGDDPQTIFETLNSRGIDLSAGDLMRNFIFQRAKGLGQTGGSLNVDDLYVEHWLPLDKWFWREGDSRGRQTKPRLDWLLTDHLSMKKAELVSVENLFENYRSWILNEGPFDSVSEELKSISVSATIERRIMEQKNSDALGRFGQFSKAFDVSTTMPLVLYLATEAGLDDDLEEALRMIESFIVRRDICGLTTKNYNRLFADMVDRIRNCSAQPIDELKSQLSSGQSDISRWPDNVELQSAWLGRDQYKPARQPRLRYLFEEIEKDKRTTLSESIEIKSTLTIEHIMPKKWREHWPVPGFDHIDDSALDADKIAREIERDQHIDKLGNLTLLTHSLNAKVSHSPFSEKMPAVRAHASLALNRELNQFDRWDEETIDQRGMMLLDSAKKIWHGPLMPQT